MVISNSHFKRFVIIISNCLHIKKDSEIKIVFPFFIKKKERKKTMHRNNICVIKKSSFDFCEISIYVYKNKSNHLAKKGIIKTFKHIQTKVLLTKHNNIFK